MNQINVVFHKNLLLYKQERQYLSEFITAILIFVLLLVAKNQLIAALLEISAQFLPITLIVSSRFIVTQMINEKSERQKEIQKIMGLKGSAYQIGWFAFNFTRIITISSFFLVLAIPTQCLGEEGLYYLSPLQMICAYFLYAIALMAQSYFLTTIFDVPRNGADCAMLLSIFGCCCTSLMNLSYFKENNWILILFGIVFPTFQFDIYPFHQILSQIPINNIPINMSKSLYFGILGFDIVIYSLAYLYLEQVIPNEYGSNKHPLFFIGFSYQTNNQTNNSNSEVTNINKPFINSFNSEDSSSALYHEVFENQKQVKKAIILQNVQKSFVDLKAVNNVSLNIYDYQILCLLGHNGAGKTTLISILTGLIKKDNGLITYYGEDTNFDIIRNYLGICPQKDVLYDNLTCDQHLIYYGKIKGIENETILQQVDTIVAKCDLLKDRSKLAKNLSGGTKRKLSLAIALMGGSKVIFLDEPTSGMDPISRQKMWDILIEAKSEGKCLLLTTHHLDEAEVLSERIAVMAKGRLLTVGSVDFIKQNFGVGYDLMLYDKINNESKWKAKSQQLINLINNKIPEYKQLTQISSDCLGFQIPFKYKNLFVSLFEILERDESIQINLVMNTLEEAFINIGMDEEAFLAKSKRRQSQVEEIKINIDINEEFRKIIPPQCLCRPPQYLFQNQLWACLLKKQYNMSLKRYLICILIPGIFQILGPIIAKITYNSVITNYDPPLDETQSYSLLSTISLIDAYIYTILGAVFASSQFGGAPVEEREKRQKYALNVMGCRYLPYWTGYYIYDFTICICLLIIFIITVAGCGLTVLNNLNVYFLHQYLYNYLDFFQQVLLYLFFVGIILQFYGYLHLYHHHQLCYLDFFLFIIYKMLIAMLHFKIQIHIFL